MALAANSYGSTAAVAGLEPRYTTAGGVFDATTKPTLTQLEGWIDEISAILNVMLAKEGFKIPINQADCKLALDLFVNQEAAAMVEGLHGSGRFGPSTGKGTPKGRFALMMDDVKGFIESQAMGFELLGATRTTNLTDGVAYRDTDESGDAIHPIFQREGFGNSFDNWDE